MKGLYNQLYVSNPNYPINIIMKIFENIEEGIMVTDIHKNILVVNPAFEKVTGYHLDEVIGKKPSFLQSGVHDQSFYKKMWKSIEQYGMWQGEIWNRRKSGELYPEWLSILTIKDENGEITNFCGIFTDLSERKIVENELEKRALTDTLTGVNNRFSYLERMKDLLQSTSMLEESIQHAVFFLDLDRFKKINDTLGHRVGDILLVEVARRLTSILSSKGFIARYGGDEFIITLLNIAHPREAAKFADDIISIIEMPVVIDDHEIFISTSIGISVFPHDGNNVEELINRADKAMYYSKQQGRNCFSFYFDDLNIDRRRVLLLDAELRKAIDTKDFSLHFQPKICLENQKIIGVEALVRWYSHKLGQVSPSEFIPYAEDSGLIIPIGEIIFEKACEELIKLKAAGYSQMTIAMNVSSIHFQQHNFLESLKCILDKYNLSAQNFEIEVTERTVMNNDHETVKKLVELKQLGFKISIDDFGTGYSSLSYLVRFPLDYLKIDSSFIQHIATLDDKQAIVDAIIQMAYRLNIKVIAEGVETEQQVKILRKLKCNIIQGYYYCEPIPMDDLIDFLQVWEIEQEKKG